MKIEVNIGKGHAIALGGILAIFTGIMFVVSYGGNQPSVMGHSWGEIELPAGGAIWPGLNADMVDGKHASELGGGGDVTIINAYTDDKSDKCADIAGTPSTVTPNDICKALGYASCASANGRIHVYSDAGCSSGSHLDTAVGACDENSGPLPNGIKSAKVEGTLLCYRQGSGVSRDLNVPGGLVVGKPAGGNMKEGSINAQKYYKDGHPFGLRNCEIIHGTCYGSTFPITCDAKCPDEKFLLSGGISGADVDYGYNLASYPLSYGKGGTWRVIGAHYYSGGPTYAVTAYALCCEF